MSKMMNKINPCPLCGHNVILAKAVDSRRDYYFLCMNCQRIILKLGFGITDVDDYSDEEIQKCAMEQYERLWGRE